MYRSPVSRLPKTDKLTPKWRHVLLLGGAGISGHGLWNHAQVCGDRMTFRGIEGLKWVS